MAAHTLCTKVLIPWLPRHLRNRCQGATALATFSVPSRASRRFGRAQRPPTRIFTHACASASMRHGACRRADAAGLRGADPTAGRGPAGLPRTAAYQIWAGPAHSADSAVRGDRSNGGARALSPVREWWGHRVALCQTAARQPARDGSRLHAGATSDVATGAPPNGPVHFLASGHSAMAQYHAPHKHARTHHRSPLARVRRCRAENTSPETRAACRRWATAASLCGPSGGASLSRNCEACCSRRSAPWRARCRTWRRAVPR